MSDTKNKSGKPRRPKPNKSTAPQIEGAEARRVAAILLTRTLDDGRGFDGLTDPVLGLPDYKQLPELDRLLARAIARTALARKGQIDLALKRTMDRKPPQKARHLIHTLSAAAAQILFMDVPDSAAVNIAVNLIDRDPRTNRFKSLANAVLRRMSREKDDLLPKLKSDKLNTPKWIYDRWKNGFDHVAARAIATHHADCHATTPPLDLSARIDPADLASKIEGSWLLDNNTIRVPNPVDVRTLPGFETGDFWVQDAASSLPALLLNATAGQRVADLCAAPGGKTAQLAKLGAQVTSVDQSAPRLARLKGNIERLKLSNHVTPVCADLMEWEPVELFDAVLLDAPCSSTGTIRRHPDILWTKSANDIASLATLQFNLIERAIKFVKVGGTFVFSNCSLDTEEGENLCKRIVETLPSLELMPIDAAEVPGYAHAVTDKGTLRSLPSKGPTGWERYEGATERGGDGFFAARFKRIS